jgi:hypothetical protein
MARSVAQARARSRSQLAPGGSARALHRSEPRQGGEAGDGLYAVHVEYARMSYISPGILEKNITTTTYTTYYYYIYLLI